MPMPRSRGETLTRLAAAIEGKEVALDRSADRQETRARLLDLKGVGPWTADYILMRALGDPDVFLPSDVAVRAVLAGRGVFDPGGFAASVRPWRSYAVMHLWAERLDALATARDRPEPPRPSNLRKDH